jgi:RNA polymerase sigma factor (sigma-70 family)
MSHVPRRSSAFGHPELPKVEEEEIDLRLTQLTTQWTLVIQAHQGTPEQVASAQIALMDRYAGAIHRYLLGALRDPEAAEELDQEFALRFVRGDFHRADPAYGRFRDFVKRALRNLMTDYRRRQRTRPKTMGDDLPDIADSASDDSEFDRQFVASWRAEVMARAWSALSRLQKATGHPYHTVLRLRVEHPEMRSPELAERLSAMLGRPINAGALRMALQRSRDRFVEFLQDEVTGCLSNPSPEEVEQELIELRLLEYCKPGLKRNRRTS